MDINSRALLLGASASGPLEEPDPNFKNTSLLLSGNGANGAGNGSFIDSSGTNTVSIVSGGPGQGMYGPYGNKWSNYFPGYYVTSPGVYKSRIEIAGTSTINLNGQDFTLECWINPSSVNFRAAINWGDGGFSTESGLWVTNDANWRFGLQAQGGGVAIRSETYPVAGKWYHVAITRSGSTTRMFVNGVLETTTTASYTLTTGQLWRIGDRPDNAVSAQYPFHGYISNVRLVEGSALYTSNFTPSTTPLTAVPGTRILTCQSNRFIENAVGANLSVSNLPKVSSFSPFEVEQPKTYTDTGGSLTFEQPSSDVLSVPLSTSFTATGNQTIEFWMYGGDVYGNNMAPCGMGSTSNGFYVQYFGGAIYLKYGSVYTNYFVDTPFEWAHIAIVREGSVVRMYHNGVLRINATITTDPVTSGATVFKIGDGAENPIVPFHGLISDFRITHSALYSGATLTVPTAPLPVIGGATKLLVRGSNGAIYDATGHASFRNYGSAPFPSISSSITKYGSGSIYFPGSSALQTVGKHSFPVSDVTRQFAWGLYNLGQDFTIELWFYRLTSTTGRQDLLGNYQGASHGFILGTSVTNSGDITFAFGNSVVIQSGANAYAVNTWTHVAVVRLGGVITLYINGNNFGNTTDFAGNLFATSDELVVGNGTRGAGTNYWFNGYIDDLRITKGIARYTTNFTPPTEHPAFGS